MQAQVVKCGSSLGVRIPGAYAKHLNLKARMVLDVSLVDGGLLLRPPRSRYTLEELVAQIMPENLHGETDWGPAVGREM
jgi:antitoxin MazE